MVMMGPGLFRRPRSATTTLELGERAVSAARLPWLCGHGRLTCRGWPVQREGVTRFVASSTALESAGGCSRDERRADDGPRFLGTEGKAAGADEEHLLCSRHFRRQLTGRGNMRWKDSTPRRVGVGLVCLGI